MRGIIIHFGYSDGSGEYYIIIDTVKCNGCGECVQKCPQSALTLETMLIELEDKTVASVKEEHRKKLKYTCSSCKPQTSKVPCELACESKALKLTWKAN